MYGSMSSSLGRARAQWARAYGAHLAHLTHPIHCSGDAGKRYRPDSFYTLELPIGRARRALAPTAEVEQQQLGLLARGERNGALNCDANAVARGQHDVAEHHRSLHEVEPGAAPRRELVEQVLPGVEHCRVHQGILVNAQRACPTVRRGNDAEHATPFRRAEASLHAVSQAKELRLDRRKERNPEEPAAKSPCLRQPSRGAGDRDRLGFSPHAARKLTHEKPGAPRKTIIGSQRHLLPTRANSFRFWR